MVPEAVFGLHGIDGTVTVTHGWSVKSDAAGTALRLTRVRELTRSGIARSLRLGAGLSVGEVARDIGRSVTCVFLWETGQRRPTGEAALRYLELLEGLIQRTRAS